MSHNKLLKPTFMLEPHLFHNQCLFHNQKKKWLKPTNFIYIYIYSQQFVNSTVSSN